MSSILIRSLSNAVTKRCCRHSVMVSTAKHCHSYEGDGKTTVTILNMETDSPLMVNSFSQHGFRLNNGFYAIGPLALFPKSALAWDVKNAAHITPESLSAFVVLEPKIDILVIGVGDHGQQVSQETQKYVRSKGISLEILPTDHACTTYNFLNVERRYVAAALIPPQSKNLGRYEESLTDNMRKKLVEED